MIFHKKRIIEILIVYISMVFRKEKQMLKSSKKKKRKKTENRGVLNY